MLTCTLNTRVSFKDFQDVLYIIPVSHCEQELDLVLGLSSRTQRRQSWECSESENAKRMTVS